MSESPWSTLTRMYHADWYPNHSTDKPSKDCYECQRIHGLIAAAERRGREIGMAAREDVDTAYAMGQRDMLARDCIAAMEFLHDHNPDQAAGLWAAICELRALGGSE